LGALSWDIVEGKWKQSAPPINSRRTELPETNQIKPFIFSILVREILGFESMLSCI
jgi:hypothetical protein